tara:strand:+ start:25682 stop:26587 length:906 start_codon:yes stop_codon:yes gene_type:complete
MDHLVTTTLKYTKRKFMKGSEIRKRLHSGECVIGTHITGLPNPNVTSLAAGMELDFAFFCTEHLPLDRNEISLLCRYYAQQAGVSPIVRVPSADDTASIATTLDAGADGIIVPYIETEHQVRQASAAIRYRPIKGQIQQELIEGQRSLSLKMETYLEDFNRDNYLIIGIESVPAIKKLEALITAAPVDGVFLGPHDITVSMGIPEEYSHPDFVQAVEDIILRCRRNNVGVGIHLPLLQIDPEILAKWTGAGMNFLINGTDIAILREAMNSQIRRLRDFTQTSTSQEPKPESTHKQAKTCIV